MGVWEHHGVPNSLGLRDKPCFADSPYPSPVSFHRSCCPRPPDRLHGPTRPKCWTQTACRPASPAVRYSQVGAGATFGIWGEACGGKVLSASQGRLRSLRAMACSTREAWVPRWARLDVSPPGAPLPLLTAPVGVHGGACGWRVGQPTRHPSLPGTAHFLAWKVLHLGKPLSPEPRTLLSLGQEDPGVPPHHE